MASKRNLRWEEMDKPKTELSVLMQHFEVHNRTEGKSPRTVGWYNEVLGMFTKWLKEGKSSTEIGDIDENMVRRFISISKRSRGSRVRRPLTPSLIGYGR